MGNSIFGIGASGLNVAQAGLVTTGHNITNASTPGFSRQEIVQSSNLPVLSGAGFFGQGAQVSTVKRMYSDFLSNQVNLAQTQGSQLDSYSAEIKQIDNMLGDVSAGLAPALQEFFSGVNDVAANPASMPSRQAMLSGAKTLAARFQSLDQRLTEIGSGINGALQSSIGAINSFARQIAALNNNINIAEAATNMQPANDLRDQRDMLIAELGKEIRVSTAIQSDGSYNVFVGNGQPVVVGRQTFDLVAATSLEDASRLEVGYNSGTKTVLLGSSTLQGGNLGGLLAFRSETLDSTRNAIGRVAIGLASAFNAQHKLGQDLNGEIGVDLFEVASPAVLPRTGNAGNAAVSASITDASALTTGDYRLNFKSEAGGNSTYTLTRVSDATSTDFTFAAVSGGSLTKDGVTVTIPASPPGAAGVVNDSWLIEPTRVGALDFAVALKDPSKIAAASQIATAAGLANQGNGAIASGKVTDSALWNAAGNNKNFTIKFSVSAAVPPVTTYDIVDNVANKSLFTGLAPAANGPYLGSYANGSPIVFSQIGPPAFDFGAKATVSGAPLNGDTFTVRSNLGGVSDSSNAVALAGLQTAKSLGKDASVAGGKAVLNFQQAYAQLVSDVGNKSRQTEVMATAQKNLIAQTKKAQQSIAGVSLDDEAANLLRYQQAYQASGKMMQIATGLFQTLLDINR